MTRAEAKVIALNQVAEWDQNHLDQRFLEYLRDQACRTTRQVEYIQNERGDTVAMVTFDSPGGAA